MSKYSSLFGLLLVSVLTGCATPPAPKPYVMNTDPAAKTLDNAIARMGAPRMPGRDGMDMQAKTAVYTMNSVRVSYVGDVKVLLKDIATQMGLTYQVTGPQPHQPIFVQIASSGEPLPGLLTNVARQLGQRADIVFDHVSDTGPAGTRGSLELRYRQ